MQLKSFCSALAIIASLNTVSMANAADVLKPHKVIIVPSAPIFSWAGPYLGVELGSSPERFYVMDKADSWVAEDIRDLGNPSKNILTGLYGGYNFQLGQHAIFGIDGNIDLHDSQTQTGTPYGGPNIPALYHLYKERGEAALRIRLGYAQGRLLPYIAGGLSVLNSGFTEGAVEEGMPSSNQMVHNHSGWNIGAGIDYMIAPNISLRADYRFNKIDIKNSYDMLDGVLTKNYIGVKSNQFRIGLAYKFLATSPLAHAADILVDHATPTAPAFNWAGPYLGFEAGVNHNKFNLKSDVGLGFFDKLFNQSRNIAFPGLYAGYNIAINQHAILGLEGNIDLPLNSLVEGIITTPTTNPTNAYESHQEKALASGRIRLGYAHGRFLPYIASGVSMMYSSSTIGLLAHGVNPLKNGFQNYTAWNIGAGVDYAMARNIILRADYSFQKFKKVKLGEILQTDPGSFMRYNLGQGSIKSHQLRLGVAYKF